MIELEVVSPQRSVVKVLCDQVTLPGSKGDFQVLPGHTPALSSLKTGILSYAKNGAAEERLMVAGGFAEVDHDHVTVLCEAAALPEEVEAKTEQEFIDKMQEQIKELKEGEEKEFRRLEAEVERSTVKLRLL